MRLLGRWRKHTMPYVTLINPISSTSRCPLMLVRPTRVVLVSIGDLPPIGPISRGRSLMPSYQEILTRRSLESAPPLVCVARIASKQADVAGPILVDQGIISSLVLGLAGELEHQSHSRYLYFLHVYSLIWVLTDQQLLRC